MTIRDNFTAQTRRILAFRVGHKCSNPDCRHSTIGPAEDEEGTINVGVAAHITAAAPGGPRYDESLLLEQRSAGTNGIWLCQNCAKLIDSDQDRYTTQILQQWKDEAVERALRDIATGGTAVSVGPRTYERDESDNEFLSGLQLRPEDSAELVAPRMMRAASRDLKSFRESKEWPKHTLALHLSLKIDQEEIPVTLDGIARHVGAVQVLNIVSEPGTGKTTTVVQLGESLVALGRHVPALVLLGEWSSQPLDFFHFLCGKHAFSAFRTQHFMQAAFHGQLVLLLDGWNELSGDYKLRAINHIAQLTRDYPLLGFVFSSRPTNLPLPGATVSLDSLSEDQQLELGRAVRADDGAEMVERAWRTPGLAELVGIPLYLNALLATPAATFPATKEEVLRLFVQAHDRAPARVQKLENELSNRQTNYLIGLSVEANRTSNTLILASNARRIVTDVGTELVAQKQLNAVPMQDHVLDVLTSTIMLVKTQSADPGYSFQHQQFQEWYASFHVESLMQLADLGDEPARKRLRFDILDWPSWEESILFACERLSRTGAEGACAVSQSILYALEIDPMLAAEMIYRSSLEAWTTISQRVVDYVGRWHLTGKVDRAIRFMIQTGRGEFAPQMWPLIDTANDQLYLRTFDAAPRFHVSVLGEDAPARLAKLPEPHRGRVVEEIAHRSSFEGIELATSLALAESSPEVVAEILRALIFRRADRQVTRILRQASAQTWELVAKRIYPEDLVDPVLRERLTTMRQSETSDSADPIRAVYTLSHQLPTHEAGLRLREVIESPQFPMKQENVSAALHQAFERFPEQTAAALATRLALGLEVPYRADQFLEKAPTVDDGPIVDLALSRKTDDRRVHTALGIVGPKTVGTLLDELFVLADVRAVKGEQWSHEERLAYGQLRDAIRPTRALSFFTAIMARIDSEVPHRMGLLAELIAHHSDPYEPGKRAIPVEIKTALIPIVERWIGALLGSPAATRHECSEIVRMVTLMPDSRFVAGLEKMLERELSEYGQAREARSRPRPPARVIQQSGVTYTPQYATAFASIGGPEATAVLYGYLRDPMFGARAAVGLLEMWNKEHPRDKNKLTNPSHDFTQVRSRRTLRQGGAALPTCDYAEEIFKVVRELGQPDRSESDQKLAVALATTGLAMPHGTKRPQIDTLLDLPLPYAAKRGLLTSVAMAGEVLSPETLLATMRELVDAAVKQPWLLLENTGEVSGRLELFSFCERPAAVVEALEMFPEPQRKSWHWRELLMALGQSPDDRGLEALLALARYDPAVIQQYEWLNAIVSFGTEAAARTFLKLIIDGTVPAGKQGADSWRLSRDLAQVGAKFPMVFDEMRQRYAQLPSGTPKLIIETALVERPDVGIVLSLVRAYAADGRQYGGALYKAVSSLAVGRRPAEGIQGMYELVGRPLVQLRKDLFKMTGYAEPLAELARNCLLTIEKARDEHGRLDNEPRHPDIESGRPWPMAV